MNDSDSDLHSPITDRIPLENGYFQQPGGIKNFLQQKKKQIIMFAVGAVALFVAVLCIGVFIVYLIQSSNDQKCLARPLHPLAKEDLNADPMPLRFKGSLLLKNVNILTGIKDESKYALEGADILVRNGKIVSIGKDISTDKIDKVLKLNGHIVSPGLVDSHSHIGVYALPEYRARQDGNEMTNPIFPQVRAVDALFPTDPAIYDTLRGGVTTAQILPGSGNIMGGEAVMIKLRGETVDDLRIKNAPRSLKMACGENPKTYYGGRWGTTPMSRMGAAWLMREVLSRAKKLMLEQDAWDCNVENVGADSWTRPSDLALDPLVSLLRHEAILNTHCYEVEDLEMMIRLSKEFDFKIATFHHGLSAYKIPNQIRDNGITVATFADMFGYKVEAYEASVYAPKILDEAGVAVAMKSDHPVSHSKDLVAQAARSHYYGFKEESAVASVTSIPAAALHLSNRIGTIEVGKDADLVIWDRHPLELGARPMKAFIEGKEVFTSDRPLRSTKTRITPTKKPSLTFTGECNRRGFSTFSSYAVKNAKIYTMDDNETVLTNKMIVVKDGLIACMDDESQCSQFVTGNTPVFTVKDGETIVTPGLIEASTPLGLFEIEAEDSTSDGQGFGSVSEQSRVQAMNGIRLQSKTMQAAWAGGVVSAVTAPISGSLIEGLSVAFHTAGEFLDEVLVNSSMALHITLGEDGKSSGSLASSVSGQFTLIENQLKAASSNADPENPFYQVLNGLPLAVRVNDATTIHSLIRLKKKYDFKLIIIGGAEAHLLAKSLKEADVSVILTPNREGYVATEQYQTLRSDDTYGAETLYKAGVNVGVGMGTLFNARNLRWQAGLLADSGDIPHNAAVKMVTRTIADMFNIGNGVGRVQVGTPANFVVFSGNPLTYEGRIMVAAAKDKVTCIPEQF